MRIRLVVLVLLAACAPAAKSVSETLPATSDERHFASVKQLTFGGENAEAYFSHDGTQLSLQAHGEGAGGCDRIYRMLADGSAKPIQVSNGEGATTCAFFFPGDEEIIYASTQLGGAACPPKPDHSLGYVWPLYKAYEIFKRQKDGTTVQLTKSPGYDAEATVCKKDGTILFTSVRDGDLELYKMDRYGENVVRLTFTEGYDGGAFFSDDCTKIVWRASRPQLEGDKALADYRGLLAQGLVRPSKLELYVSNADGSEARQLTYLNAASFAPYFFPDAKRIIFSSNYGDPRGREFDIFAIDVDGTRLERVTTSKGFDGFPMFSADGKRLVFASNRATPEGKHDTNVFMAEWKDAQPSFAAQAADRIAADTRALAADGRAPGSKGFEAAAAVVVSRLTALSQEGRLQPPKRQRFTVKTEAGAVETENLYAYLPGTDAALALSPLVIGAHLDHLSAHSSSSLDPSSKTPHYGADDNASGSAALIEIARTLSSGAPLARGVYFVWFSGEELGVLGSAHFVKNAPANEKFFAMLNLDMVGRVRANALTVLGAESAKEWKALVEAECRAARVFCNASGDGYGPSDQTPFFAAGVPVLHFFSGAHSDYHKPSDTADKLNYAGVAKVSALVSAVASRVTAAGITLSYVTSTKPAAPRGQMKSSLGTIPDYGGPPPGVVGMPIQGVREGSAAQKAGITRGDVLTQLGPVVIKSVEDLMTALMTLEPNEELKASVLREGKTLVFPVTLQPAQPRVEK
jgi:Zn-dependent M28 family amino/carboxypeptidase